MDERTTKRVNRRNAAVRPHWLARCLAAMLGYGLAIAMMVVAVRYGTLLEHYGGDGLTIIGYVLIPLWLLSGTMGLMGSVRSGFWFAVSPLLVGLVILALANLV